MPDVQAALEGGALVADVGCGRGGVVLMLAQAFPRARFVGYDAFSPNIVKAQANSQAAGVTDRVRFVRHNASQELPERYDIVLSFDTLHHAINVLGFMRAIRESIHPNGISVCKEAACADTLEANIGPGGAIAYASGVLVCVPQVLSESDEALGVAGLPFSKMREPCAQAGFGNPRLVHLEDSSNNLYEIKL